MEPRKDSEEQFHWRLPARPGEGQTNPVRGFDLGEIVGKTDWGSAFIVDLMPGATSDINLPSHYFIEVIEGQIQASGHKLRQRMAGQFPSGPLTIRNTARKRPARIILISSSQKPQDPIEVKTWRILGMQPKDRPKNIRLRSMSDETTVIDYEWVRINRLVPRHNHHSPNPEEPGSFALIYVISGEGQFGFSQDDGPGRIARFRTGSVMKAGPGDWHGFKPKRRQRGKQQKQVTIVSIQLDQSIDELYTFATTLGIAEFSYEDD